jgi:hypothetical protein
MRVTENVVQMKDFNLVFIDNSLLSKELSDLIRLREISHAT